MLSRYSGFISLIFFLTLSLSQCKSENRNDETISRLIGQSCFCKKKPIPFIGGFIAGKHPEMAYELWCSVSEDIYP